MYISNKSYYLRLGLALIVASLLVLSGVQIAAEKAYADEDIYYPDAHPETSTCDGVAFVLDSGLTWSQLRGHAGNYADSSTAYQNLFYLQSDTTENTWVGMMRTILTFDTSDLPDTADISAVTLSIYGFGKSDTAGWTPNINVYSASPASNTNIVAGDYDSLGTIAYCDTPITYSGWSTSTWNTWTLNAAGIAAISTTGITQLGLRNANYDVANISPTWASGITATIVGILAEGGAEYAPKLTVTYTEGGTSVPTVGTISSSNVEETSANVTAEITNTGGENADYVGIEWGTYAGGVYTNNNTVSGDFGVEEFNIAISGLSPGTAYYARGISHNSAGWGYASDNVVLLTKPLSASNFACTANGTKSLNFAWDAGSGADIYEARYWFVDYPSDNNSCNLGYWGGSTSFTLSGLSSNLTVYLSLHSHASEAGLSSTADSFVTAQGTTDNRTYPDYGINDGASEQCVVVGDSLDTHGFPTTAIINHFEDITGYSTYNGAVSGYTSQNISDYFDTNCILRNPKIVIIGGGTNDLFNSHADEATFLANMTSMFDKCEASDNISLVLVKTIPPVTGSVTGNCTQMDIWNADLTTLVESYSDKFVMVDENKYVGVYREGSPANTLWDLYLPYSEDGMHIDDPGRIMVARALAGGVPEFTTVPTVTTQAASNVQSTTATANGTITNTGGANCTSVGFQWDTDSGAPYSNNQTSNGDYGAEAFVISLTSLPAGTTIYGRAFAQRDTDIGYGSEVSFLTKPAAPTNISSGDGTSTSNIPTTWTKSTGATNYYVLRNDVIVSGLLGDVATWTDTSVPSGPDINMPTFAASNGSSNTTITITCTDIIVNTYPFTYKVIAVNDSGNSAASSGDTGYIGYGVPVLTLYKSGGDADNDYSTVEGFTEFPYSDVINEIAGYYYYLTITSEGCEGIEIPHVRGYTEQQTSASPSSTGGALAVGIIGAIACALYFGFRMKGKGI